MKYNKSLLLTFRRRDIIYFIERVVEQFDSALTISLVLLSPQITIALLIEMQDYAVSHQMFYHLKAS